MNPSPPPVLELLQEFIELLKRDIVVYVLGGVGLVLVVLPVSVVAVFGVYLAMGLGMLPGMLLESEGALILGMLGAIFAYAAALGIGITLISAPLQASLMRAMNAHFEGGAPLGFGAAFSTAGEDLPRVLGFAFLHGVLIFVLAMFCYLPGIAFALLTDFAWSHVVLGKRGPVEALQLSIKDATDNPPWHLGYVLVTVGMAMVVTYIPLVGYFLAPGVLAAWRVLVWRRVFIA